MISRYILIAALFTLFSCAGEAEKRSYTSTGLAYVMHKNEAPVKAEIGDILVINLSYGTEDTLIFDSKQYQKPVYIQLTNPAYKGSLEEGLAMLGSGDSATFYLSADSVYQRIFNQPPPAFLKPGDELIFQVGVMAVKNEDRELADWFTRENMTASPRPSGLYILPIQSGKANARQAAPGSKAKVHYTGYLLDGTKFDSSVDRGEPFQFQVGKGQVIPGWDEGVSTMKVGDKVKLVIPSYLAYGPRGASNIIPPYAPLLFEVELLDVMDMP
jgi:FKBP-type peptidyl-prolyl cis-trans isomerase